MEEIRAKIFQWLRMGTRFLLPAQCGACGAPLSDDPVPLFCTACWASITPIPRPACPRCDRPFVSPAATSHSPGHCCANCTEHPPAYIEARTLYPYVPPLQDAICLLKYRGKVALVPALVRLMVNHLPPRDRFDVVVPVPLHPDRLRAREFNQSLLLADRIARHLRLPFSSGTLVRLASSAPQTTLSRKERLKNLRGAFAVRDPGRIAGKRVLLIDDVFTTGATMNECANTLTRDGAAEVFALTLARTVESHSVPDRIQAQHAHPALGLWGG